LSICTPTETMHSRHEEFATIARQAARTLLKQGISSHVPPVNYRNHR
jgi:hypothetical protein